MSLTFRREVLTARAISPDGSGQIERRLEVRFDPLLGTSSRISEGVRLQTAEGDLSILKSSSSCPFCPPRLQQMTPRIPAEISSEPRIHVGDSVLFPNLVPYSQYSAVAVFSGMHWLDLPDFTVQLLSDNLAAAVEYIRRVHGYDSQARFAAYNINYLFPSGGSLPHPHSQVYVDRFPTTMMRVMGDASRAYREENETCYWQDLVAHELVGERFVGRLGQAVWLTPFAPIGFNEVRAIFPKVRSVLHLTQQDVSDLAAGISRVLLCYDSLGYNSFNLALYSDDLRAGDDSGFRLNLSIITRTGLAPFYRSDSMYLERLHWEAALDRTPEDVAASIREYW